MGDLPGVGNKIPKTRSASFPWGLAFVSVQASAPGIPPEGWSWRWCVASGPGALIVGGPEALGSWGGAKNGFGAGTPSLSPAVQTLTSVCSLGALLPLRCSRPSGRPWSQPHR